MSFIFQTSSSTKFSKRLTWIYRKSLLDTSTESNRSCLRSTTKPTALARQYIESEFSGNTSLRVYRDCAHVAIATTNGIKHVVSFNYRHLVNDRKIDGFSAVNIRSGYDHVIDITTPHRFLVDVEQE